MTGQRRLRRYIFFGTIFLCAAHVDAQEKKSALKAELHRPIRLKLDSVGDPADGGLRAAPGESLRDAI